MACLLLMRQCYREQCEADIRDVSAVVSSVEELMTNCIEKGYIFLYLPVFDPVREHWCMILIHQKNGTRTMYFMDSIFSVLNYGSDERYFVSHVMDYVEPIRMIFEEIDKVKGEVFRTDLFFGSALLNFACQRDRHSCGVYVVEYARRLFALEREMNPVSKLQPIMSNPNVLRNVFGRKFDRYIVDMAQLTTHGTALVVPTSKVALPEREQGLVYATYASKLIADKGRSDSYNNGRDQGSTQTTLNSRNCNASNSVGTILKSDGLRGVSVHRNLTLKMTTKEPIAALFKQRTAQNKHGKRESERKKSREKDKTQPMLLTVCKNVLKRHIVFLLIVTIKMSARAQNVEYLNNVGLELVQMKQKKRAKENCKKRKSRAKSRDDRNCSEPVSVSCKSSCVVTVENPVDNVKSFDDCLSGEIVTRNLTKRQKGQIKGNKERRKDIAKKRANRAVADSVDTLPLAEPDAVVESSVNKRQNDEVDGNVNGVMRRCAEVVEKCKGWKDIDAPSNVNKEKNDELYDYTSVVTPTRKRLAPSALGAGPRRQRLTKAQRRRRYRRQRRDDLRRLRAQSCRLHPHARKADLTNLGARDRRGSDPAWGPSGPSIGPRSATNRRSYGQAPSVPTIRLLCAGIGNLMAFHGVERRQRKKRIVLGTVNVRSIRADVVERTQVLKAAAVKHGLYAMTICETRLPGDGVTDLEDGWIMVHHNEANGLYKGVATLLSPPAAQAWRSDGSTMECSGDGRVMLLRLKAALGEKQWYIMVGYAPTAKSDAAHMDQFLADCSRMLKMVRKRSFVWIGGDFNSRTGSRGRGSDATLSDVLGPHCFDDKRNERGDRLILFCKAHGLTITNGFTKNKTSKCATWYHPRWKYPAVLDLSMVKMADQGCVVHTAAMPGTDIGSDHVLLVVKLKQSPSYDPSHSEDRDTVTAPDNDLKRPKKINVRAMNDAQKRAQFTEHLDQRLQNENPDIKRMSEVVRECAEQHLGVCSKSAKSWVAENQAEIDKLLLERQWKHQAWIQNNTPGNKKEYNKAKRTMKSGMRAIEEKWFLDQASEIEALWMRGDMSGFFNASKKLAEEFPRRGVKTRAIGKQELNLPAMTDHFNKLLNINRDVNWDVVDGLPGFATNVDWSHPTQLEVQKAIGRLKNGKAEGLSGVPAECLKTSNKVATIIHDAVVQLWNSTQVSVPASWLDAILVALYKNKGQYQDLDNWRGIVLLDVVSKVVNLLLNDKLQKAGEQIWGEEQHGFRAGRGTVDCIFTMRRLVEEYGLTSPSLDADDRLYVLFVDLKKAFDSCDRQLIWKLLRKCGVPENVISLTAAFHDGFGARVMYQGKLGDRFPVSTGVRQGCCCGPTLWNYYFFFVMWLWRRRCQDEIPDHGVTIEYKNDLKVRPRAKLIQLKTKTASTVTDIQYADDTGTLDRKFCVFKRSTELLDQAVADFGGEVSLTKTEWMNIPSHTDDASLQLRNVELKKVEEFKYLGSTIGTSPQTAFGCITDTRQRSSKAASAFGRLRGVWQSRLTPKTKGRIFNVCVGSVLLYGVEAKMINRAQMMKMKHFWYGCLRSIKDLKWHTSWKNLLSEFGLEDIRVTVKKRAAGYMGHLARMDSGRMPFQTCFGYVKDRKTPADRNHAMKTIIGYYGEVAKAMPGINASNWPLQAQNRTEWKKASTAIRLQLDTIGGSFKCSGCEDQFDTQRALDRHSQRFHAAGPTQGSNCHHCGRSFVSEASLKVHAARWCKMKPDQTTNPAPQQDSQHTPAVTQPQPALDLFRVEGATFVCNICGLSRRSHCTMSRHINAAHGASRDTIQRDNAAPTIAPAGTRGVADIDPNNSRNVLCRKCGKSVSKTNWARHDGKCGVEYRCEKCNRVFDRPDSLKRHAATCQTISLICPICGREDRFPSQAKRHQDRCLAAQQ